MNPDKVQIVRSGPSLKRLKLMSPVATHKRGKKYLIGYVGVIGEQEGLDLLLQAVKVIKTQRNDVQVGIVGGGTDLEKIKQLAEDLGVADIVHFYGRASDQVLIEVLNTADICVNPDKPSEMNNLSTMNKIMEYMALKKPIVQFDLKEGRASALEASLYVKHNDVIDFAKKITYLLDNESERTRMGEYGYNRVVNQLSWQHEQKHLVALYQKVFGLSATQKTMVRIPIPPTSI